MQAPRSTAYIWIVLVNSVHTSTVQKHVSLAAGGEEAPTLNKHIVKLMKPAAPFPAFNFLSAWPKQNLLEGAK